MSKKQIAIAVTLGCFLMLALTVGGFAGCAYLIYSASKPVADSTNLTLRLLGEGKTHDAYLTMSEDYRRKVDEATFGERSKAMHLDSFKDSTWNNRNINNFDGRVSGSIEASDGVVEASATLVYEKKGWKVTNIVRKSSLTGP